jgi:glutamyl-tRNA reductase
MYDGIMSYTLGAITLPKPKKLTRTFIETSVEHLLLFGRTTKRTQNRKEQFTLEYQYLSIAQVNAILSQYELNTPLIFSINENNLTIPETEVLMDMSSRSYPKTGVEYREHLKIILMEVL